MQSEVETIQFRIPADDKYVPTIRKAIQSIASNLGFSKEVSEDIELSVDEALANAIYHGSPQSKTNSVVVVCKVCDEKLMIEVRDEGPGFEPPKSNGSSEGELWSEHGRGLRLIYNLMDNVNIRKTPKGSRIRMVKDRSEKQKCLATDGHR